MNKWGHPHLCQLDENDHLDINYKPIKLCSHYKKGKAKDEQIRLNRVIITDMEQFKSKLEIHNDKLLTLKVTGVWASYSFKRFFNDRVLLELIEAPPTLKKLFKQSP